MIQRLQEHEWSRLRAIRLRALGDSPAAFGSTLQETEKRSDAVWQRQVVELPTFVAVINSQDEGMVRGAHYDGRPDTAILLSMWVSPSARGTGASDALVERLIRWARSEGFRKLALDVGDENAHAIAFYARMGFEASGSKSSLPSPRDRITEHERVLLL